MGVACPGHHNRLATSRRIHPHVLELFALHLTATLHTRACVHTHSLWHPPPLLVRAVYTSVVGKETCVTVALLAVWPIIIEATKSLNPKDETKPVFPW